MEVPWCYAEKKTKRSEKKCNCSPFKVKLVILSHTETICSYVFVFKLQFLFFNNALSDKKKKHCDNVLST